MPERTALRSAMGNDRNGVHFAFCTGDAVFRKRSVDRSGSVRRRRRGGRREAEDDGELDERIEEYERFVVHLCDFCRSKTGEGKNVSGFLMKICRGAMDLQRRVEDTPASAESGVNSAIEEIIGALGTGHYVYRMKEYENLSKLARNSQADRLKVIRLYRQFAKTLRSEAGRAVTEDPGLRDVGNALRTMTQQILRSRYYLEDDWSGETPLRKDGE